ncbi:hypothetical protein [Microbacterium sp. NPDC077184]|uniref:hypothetical protein n=1 Tax=Microbacterium sp. NPDC077184 TaxID=3154764 RepID=UPI003418DD68
MEPVLALPSPPIALHRAADLHRPADGAARGRLHRVREGVYADAEEWAALPPWLRYLARVHAVAMTRPDAVFCLESASALLGLPVFADPVTVHTLGGTAATGRECGGVRVHAGCGDRRLVSAGGLSVTSIADTAVDLARHRHPAVGVATADAALRLDATLSTDILTAINEQRVSSRGRRRAREPLREADAAAESPLESVSRCVIRWLGFAAPILQKVFRTDDVLDRGDFWWPEASVLGEADGDLKYDGTFGDPLSALRSRRERDIRLSGHVRAVTHWGWTETTAVTPLRGILLGQGIPLVAGEDTATLLTLRRALASH